MIRKVRVRPWIAIFLLFNRNTLNNRSKIFKCLKDGGERKRKGNLRRWSELRDNARASGKASRVSGVSFHVSLARDFLLAGSLREALCISLLVSYKYADTSLCSSVVRSGRKT